MKIGIFGGSFDPIHEGHLALAKKITDSGMVDKVIFVPAANQPFKLDRKMADGADRFRMIEIAIEGENRFEVSDYELSRPEMVSYTIDTLNAMREKYSPDDEIYFITGADSFLQIHKWTRAEELLKNFPIIVGWRPDSPYEEVAAQKKKLMNEYGATVLKVDNPLLEISSSSIRDGILDEEASDYLDTAVFLHVIPEKVKEYIIEKGLYN